MLQDVSLVGEDIVLDSRCKRRSCEAGDAAAELEDSRGDVQDAVLEQEVLR